MLHLVTIAPGLFLSSPKLSWAQGTMSA